MATTKLLGQTAATAEAGCECTLSSGRDYLDGTTHIYALDMKEGDKVISQRGLGERTVRRITDHEDGTRIIEWYWGLEMHFAINEANYSTSRNPAFHVTNR